MLCPRLAKCNYALHIKREQSVIQYQFTLDGHIHQRWFLDLPELKARHLENGTTLLEGPITDQAALYGVIMKLRDSGLTLISCQRIKE